MTKARQQLRNWQAEIAIILGSGLSSINQQPIEAIDFMEFSELPTPRVPRARR
jgi:purine nucleoside phosphorylase